MKKPRVHMIVGNRYTYTSYQRTCIVILDDSKIQLADNYEREKTKIYFFKTISVIRQRKDNYYFDSIAVDESQLQNYITEEDTLKLSDLYSD